MWLRDSYELLKFNGCHHYSQYQFAKYATHRDNRLHGAMCSCEPGRKPQTSTCTGCGTSSSDLPACRTPEHVVRTHSQDIGRLADRYAPRITLQVRRSQTTHSCLWWRNKLSWPSDTSGTMNMQTNTHTVIFTIIVHIMYETRHAMC